MKRVLTILLLGVLTGPFATASCLSDYEEKLGRKKGIKRFAPLFAGVLTYKQETFTDGYLAPENEPQERVEEAKKAEEEAAIMGLAVGGATYLYLRQKTKKAQKIVDLIESAEWGASNSESVRDFVRQANRYEKKRGLEISTPEEIFSELQFANDERLICGPEFKNIDDILMTVLARIHAQ
jgi:esterase/lipase